MLHPPGESRPGGRMLLYGSKRSVWFQLHSLAFLARQLLGKKESRMTTKPVFCESSGHSVAQRLAPLLGMFGSWCVCCFGKSTSHVAHATVSCLLPPFLPGRLIDGASGTRTNWLQCGHLSVISTGLSVWWKADVSNTRFPQRGHLIGMSMVSPVVINC